MPSCLGGEPTTCHIFDLNIKIEPKPIPLLDQIRETLEALWCIAFLLLIVMADQGWFG